MGTGRDLVRLAGEIEACRDCPRLVDWREAVARERRAAYADQAYWGRAVPGFGDADAWLLVVGLAPAAHGANRTGRMFTGDRSGEWLFRAMHAHGLASQPDSTDRDDGLRLDGAYVTACVRCAPPGNRPRPDEWRRCRRYLDRELDALTGVSVIVALGGYAYERVLRLLADRGLSTPSPRPRFAHALEIDVPPYRLLASMHPSQQNTFTGRLTAPMFDRIWRDAERLRPKGRQ